MSTLGNVLEGRENTVHTVGPDTTILEAVGEMCRRHVRALLVNEDELPIGILSVRDILKRVLLEHRDASTTRVAEVMTRDLVSIELAVEPCDALAVMTERHIHHLPVVDSSTVIGLLSIDDLVQWSSRNQDAELQALKEYAFGPYSR